MKEQKKQDAVLNRIGQLLHDLKTHNTTAAISIFQLPPDTTTRGGGEWEQNGGGIPAYFETEEPPYCVGPYKLGNREYTKDHFAGVQYWIRVDDAMVITSGGLLSVLAPILLPQEINPREQKVASRLLSVVLKQRNKKRDNWSKFLRLRCAWYDQDGARRWVDDQNMLDFSWNDVKNPTRFGVDFGQSMEPEEVREEQREAKYWWIDIPDLTGLVLKILPTLERQREKELKAGNGNIREGKPRSLGRDKIRGGDSVEALEVMDAQEETDLRSIKRSARGQFKWAGWGKDRIERFIEENGSSIKTLMNAIKKADAQGLIHKGKKPSSSIK